MYHRLGSPRLACTLLLLLRLKSPEGLLGGIAGGAARLLGGSAELDAAEVLLEPSYPRHMRKHLRHARQRARVVGGAHVGDEVNLQVGGDTLVRRAGEEDARLLEERGKTKQPAVERAHAQRLE